QLSKLVSRMISGHLTAIDKRILARLKMARYGTWVTWDRASRGQVDPFSFSQRRCADEIRANLGLSNVGIGRSILLITYSSVHAGILHRPTCADAGLYLRFRPPPAPPPAIMDAHGLTKPWEEFPGVRPDIVKHLVLTPRPEGLHTPIAFPAGLVIERRSS